MCGIGRLGQLVPAEGRDGVGLRGRDSSQPLPHCSPLPCIPVPSKSASMEAAQLVPLKVSLLAAAFGVPAWVSTGVCGGGGRGLSRGGMEGFDL